MVSIKQLRQCTARLFAVVVAFTLLGAWIPVRAQDGNAPDDGYYRFVTTSASEIVGTALYANASSLCWKTLDENDLSFIWKITKDENSTGKAYYQMKNIVTEGCLGSQDGPFARVAYKGTQDEGSGCHSPEQQGRNADRRTGKGQQLCRLFCQCFDDRGTRHHLRQRRRRF